MARALHVGDPCPCQLVLEVSRQELGGHPHARGPWQPWVWQSVLLRCLGFPEALRRPDPQIQVVWARAPPCPPDGAESVCICGWRQLLWSPWPQLATGHFSRAFTVLVSHFCSERPVEGFPGEVAGSRLPFPHLHILDQLGPSVCLWSDCACACVCTRG